jgi:hypothetical protein
VERRVKSVEEQLAGRALGYVPRHRSGPLLGGGWQRRANPPDFAGALFKALDLDGDEKLDEGEILKAALERFDQAAARKPVTRPAAPAAADDNQSRRSNPGWRARTPATRPAGSLDEAALTAVLAELLRGPDRSVLKFRGESAATMLTRTLLHEVDRDKDSFITRDEFRLGLGRLVSDSDVNDDGVLNDREFADGLAKLFTPPRF